MASKRNRLNFETKLEIIKYAKVLGVSVRLLANKFKVGETTIRQLLKNKADVLKQSETYHSMKINNRKSKHESVNAVVYNWYCKASTEGMYLLFYFSNYIFQRLWQEWSFGKV